jgi:LPXTG-site transpeptidase (sortase) family protein
MLLGLPGSPAAAHPEANPQPAPLPEPAAMPRQAPAASISLNVPAQVPLGQDVTFTVTFDNTGSDPGYGPIIDLILDTTGIDAGAGGLPYDGLGTSSISASYLSIPFQTSGTNQNMWVLTFDGTGNATHPLMRDGSGAHITVSGTPGDTLVVLRLPFGSFAPDQPPATVSVTANMSNYADVNQALSIQARGGFEFGETPLDDWCCGDEGSITLTPWISGGVTPALLTLSKEYSGPEDEAASGPNFRTYYPLQYTVTADIAPGQSLSSVTLTDQLPNNLQVFGFVPSPPAGASCSAIGSTPGETLSCTFGGSVSGSASLTFDFYIPLNNSLGNRVLNALNGNDVSACDNASASYDWVPLDPRDLIPDGGPGTIDPVPCEHTLTEKSLALQKRVSNLTGGGNSPGDILEYSLTFQISDFFAFDGLVLADTISDGQHLTGEPTLEVAGNSFSLATAAFNAANYDVLCDYTSPGVECTIPDGTPPNTGETRLTLRVSDELITRGRANGRLIGGCVDPAGGSATPECDTGLPGGYNDGPTYATVRFQTTILDNFVDDFPSGDPSVDQGDVLGDTATVTGDVLDTDDFTPTGFNETDGSSAGLSIGTGTLSKSIYALNGSTTLPSPVEVKPGDSLTYRIQYILPTSDEENLELTDYLPLPIFNVTDPNGDGSAGPVWSFDPTVSTAAPASGVAKFGPADTFYAYTCVGSGTPAGCLAPTLTPDATNNALNFYYGDYNDSRHQPTTVDLLFTVTVSSEPFADRLYLTNQVHGFEGSTNAGTVAADDIIQIILTEPVLTSNKGVVWTSNPNALPDPLTVAPVVFTNPSSSPRWSGTINASYLAAHPVDSNVSFVDAGDIVTFAIVIQNTGSSLNGAFDIIIKDDLPAQFQIPATATGLNLDVRYGDGTGGITFTPQGGGPAGLLDGSDDLFGNGLELDDPGTGTGVCQTHDPSFTNDIILVTFDLQLRDNVTPGTIINTESLVSYAGSEGGPNHLATPQTDTAETTVTPTTTKAIVSSEIENTNNVRNEGVIGEFVTYRLTLDIPEGSMPGAQVVDTLDTGLAFVQIDSVTTSANVSHNSIDLGPSPANPSISNANGGTGNRLTFNLGNVTNTNLDDLVETIEIEYTAVVLNVAGNQDGTGLNNSAVLSWTGGSLSAVGAPNLRVIEPKLLVSKVPAPIQGDAGDTITFTMTVQHDAETTIDPGLSDADAFDLTLTDALPAGMTYAGGSLDCTGGSLTPDSCTFSGNTLSASWTQPTGFPLGSTSVFTFDVTLDASVSPDEVIRNTAYLDWTSLPGDETSPRSTHNTSAVERTGTGGVNDYTTSGYGEVTITGSPTKTIVSTSEAHTAFVSGSERVVIGEVVRYRLAFQLAEGTALNFRLEDDLYPGLRFIDDGTARAALVSNDVGITSSTLSDPALFVTGNEISLASVVPTYALPDNAVSSSPSDPNADTYNSGTNVYFWFGNLVNSDRDLDQEFAVIEFNAVVENIAGNQAYNNSTGATTSITALNNRFRTLLGSPDIPGSYSGLVTVRIAEALITNLTKTVSVTPSDAGDTVEYTITFNNSSSVARAATAFDIVLTDTLDSNLVFVSISGTPNSGTCQGGTPIAFSGGAVGQAVTATLSCLDPGAPASITLTATVVNNAPIGADIPNTTNLTYSSLPGAGTPSNPTGSNTPGSGGSATGERNGSGGVNDYSDTAQAPISLADPILSKTIASTSVSSTTSSRHDLSIVDLVIGEEVTFEIRVTLPEGTASPLRLLDSMPTVPQGVLGVLSAQVDSIGSQINTSIVSTITISDGLDADSIDDQVLFNFGDVTNTPNGVSDAGDVIVLEIVARLENVSSNQDGNQLTNNAVLTYNTDSLSATADVEVVEPLLTLVKAADDDTPSLGGAVTYTITVSNPGSGSNAVAEDIVITDAVPAGLTYLGPVTPLPAGWSLDDSAAPVLTFSAGQLGLGSSVDLSYQATLGIPPTVTVGDTFTNTATATWTSLSGLDANERTGSGSGPNDYTTSTSETITASEVDVALSKDDGILSAVPGLPVSYTLSIQNIGNVDALNVVITDTVPAYTTFAGPSGPGAWSCAIGAPAGTSCTYNLGSLAAGASTNLTFSVVVSSTLPVLVDLTTNSAIVSASNEPVLLQGNNSASHDTPLVAAPDLSIVKDDGVDTVSPGTLLIFTLTYANYGNQDASGVTITDDVPLNTTFQAGSSSAGWSCDDPDGGGPLVPGDPGSTCTYTIGALAAGAGGSVQFALHVDDPFPIGTSLITNTAVIADDGTNGPDQTPGDNQSTDRDNVVTLGNLDINKNLVATSQAFTDPGDTQLSGTPPAAIGEILTYEIVLNIPPGSIAAVQLEDVLDRGLAFVDCSSITASSGNLTTTLAGGFSSACNPDTLNPPTGNPQVLPEPSSSTTDEDQGRRILFDLGNITNTNSFGGADETLTIIYTAVVIDNESNRRGSRLNNAVHWTWSSGELSESANEAEIVEPTLTLTKNAAPRITAPGSPITFTLMVAHAASSNSAAFDLVLTDTLPPELTYIPATLACTSGACSEAGGVITVSWDTFDLGDTSQITFDVTLGPVRPGQRVLNQAALEWTSLPDDNVAAPYALSPFNALAVERRYDPTTPVDLYQVLAEVSVGAPELPATGFAPGQRTTLPPIPGQLPYSDIGGIQLEIPSLGLRSPIIGVATDESGWDLTWLWDNIGFLQGTAYPTHTGNTVLTGHVVLPSGLPGPFARLGELFWGDTVMLHSAGMTYVYEVRERWTILPNDLSVMKHETLDWVTLITCRSFDPSSGTYLRRTVVRAVLVEVRPDAE